MTDQADLFGYYTLGETRDADELWTSGGFGGPALTEFLGISNPFRVTGREALQQASVLICVDVLSQDISKATLRLRRRVPRGQRVVEADQHYVAKMLALDPNRRHTWLEFIGMMTYHLCLTCNSYAYIQRATNGDALELIPIMPGLVQDQVNRKSREIFYDINASTEQEVALLGAPYIAAPERDVCHIRHRMLDGFYGYSTLLAGGRTLTLGAKLDDYERRLFHENGLIRGIFTRPKESGQLTDDTFRRIKGQLKKLMSRVNDDGDPILLEDGITYKDMAMKANEAEMAKALDAQIEQTCKLWRMPPHKAMHLGAVKYENLATLEMIYVRDTLLPICKAIEQRLARTLLTEKERLEFYFEFDRDELSIVDQTQENVRVKTLVERSVISINEAREDQGYNPRKGGDAYVLPVNTVLVDESGEVIATGIKATPEPAAAADDNAQTDDETAASKSFVPRLVASNR